jgi:amino acid transporter
MTDDFQTPKKDFLKSMIIALIVCGALYLAITFNYFSIIDKNNIKSVMGLYQLTEHISPKNISTFIITIFAVFALATNFNSWIRGLSSMIEKSSADSDFPRFLKTDDNNGRKAIVLLTLLFSLTLIIQYLKPDFLEIALKTVSSNFVVIYILTTTSFIIKTSSLKKRLMGIVTILILTASVVSDYEKLIYPIAICSIYFVFKSIVSIRRTKNA